MTSAAAPFTVADQRGRKVQESDISSITSADSKRVSLLGNRICPFAHRAWITLHELNAQDDVEYLHADIGPTKPDWFTQYLSPYGTVPVMWDQGKIVPESLVVMKYIFEKFAPNSGFYGGTPYEKSRVDLMLGKLDVGPIYGFLMNRDPAEEESKKQALKTMLEGIEKIYEESSPIGPYLLGEHLSAGDVALVPFFARFIPVIKHYHHYDMLDASLPRLSSMWEHAQKRPAFHATAVDAQTFIEAYGMYYERGLKGVKSPIARFFSSPKGAGLSFVVGGAAVACAFLLSRRA